VVPEGLGPTVTGENVLELEREFLRSDAGDPQRRALRDALVAYHARDTDDVLAEGDYDAAVEHFASLSDYLTPAEVAACEIPPDFGAVARWIIERGSRRGDEGRVMAAHLLLSCLTDGEARRASIAERERIDTWGREVRAPLASPVQRYGDLIRVWVHHDQLAPSPEVLERLTRLYREQVEAILHYEPEGRVRFSEIRDFPLLRQRLPFDIATVYLRHGDLERTIQEVERLPSSEGSTAQLLTYLRQAQGSGRAGAIALNELAGGFVRARPDVTVAVCRLGLRRFPEDGRFPLCLARVAVQRRQWARATVWYAEAVRLEPGQREVYDEALDQLDQILGQGALAEDIEQSRAMAADALAILEERRRRFPSRQAPVSRAQLLYEVGQAEMSAGFGDRAREAYEAALRSDDVAPALAREVRRALGLLQLRLGDPASSIATFEAILEGRTDQSLEGRSERAEVHERLGDARRATGDEAGAREAYEAALRLWEALAQRVPERARPTIEVRRGVLLSRLGRAAEATRAFRAVLAEPPAADRPYIEILTHLVVSQPAPELALAVFRRAQYELSLEPVWRVYLGLWAQGVAARARTPAAAELDRLFEDLARADGWAGRLAAFGHGDLSYEALVAAASDRGEQAEAHFYEGLRRLEASDRAGATARFRDVLGTGMVAFFEYAMAQELLQELEGRPGPVADAE
jgi:tetratricopeptide (TPR) repeat protein